MSRADRVKMSVFADPKQLKKIQRAADKQGLGKNRAAWIIAAAEQEADRVLKGDKGGELVITGEAADRIRSAAAAANVDPADYVRVVVAAGAK